MRVITHTCSDCGTVVAANELEDHRIMKCPGLNCENVLRFEDLSEEARQHFLDNRDRYQL
ncbi:hypothetical protein [Halosimplex halobium]|uniref:hypothetical protein n=1 Tax=Halosimplex halobium TaxID=3396618 RepID=UPI003F5479BA